MDQPSLAEDARGALRALDWRRAALLFTTTADALPTEPHGPPSATEIGLRRNAHLALCRTEAFKKHRERAPGIKNPLEWQRPDGSLVARLLRPHGRVDLAGGRP